MSSNTDDEFRRRLTPPYAREAAAPGRDHRDVLIDLLTLQLGNAVYENRRLTQQLAALQCKEAGNREQPQGGAPHTSDEPGSTP